MMKACRLILQATVIYKRYYDVFKKGEIEKLLKQHKNVQIVNSYYDK